MLIKSYFSCLQNCNKCLVTDSIILLQPLMVVLNKCDVVKRSDLSPERQEMLNKLTDIPVMEMSAANEIGVAEVKIEACEKLLQYRVEAKLKGRKAGEIMNRIHVAMPTPRDEKERLPQIPGIRYF